MSKLLIFGAGASRNYSQANHGIKDLQMPLDADFFKMAKKIILAHDDYLWYPSRSDIEHLVRDLHELFMNKRSMDDYDLDILDDNRLTLEQVMSMFYESSLLDDSYYHWVPGVSRSRLRTLNDIIVYTLLVAQRGPNCNKHLKIANSLKDNDIIISYNYDTILDNALVNSGKLSDVGYKIEFNKVLMDKSWTPPEQNDSKVTLFKLHGSLNWLRCKRCRSNFLVKTQVNIKSRDQLRTYSHSGCPRCSKDALETVIIPPLIGKNYREAGLDYLWSEAFDVIIQNHNIRELIAIGYRLPDADVASTLLFRKINYLMVSNNRDFKLTIINPDKSIDKHFGGIFTTSNISHYYSLQQYVDTLS